MPILLSCHSDTNTVFNGEELSVLDIKKARMAGPSGLIYFFKLSYSSTLSGISPTGISSIGASPAGAGTAGWKGTAFST